MNDAAKDAVTEDPELVALRKIIAAIEELDRKEAVSRIIEYLYWRFVESNNEDAE